ncbi:hypothetical protein VE02_04754 [Pseudogymnoascus sp. 03VT05]|nr:hypothetical protein VE02_04754 [Pseudogymnoascus sp. 03VT05]
MSEHRAWDWTMLEFTPLTPPSLSSSSPPPPRHQTQTHHPPSPPLPPSSLSDLLASHITHLPYPIYTSLLRASPRDTLPASSLSTLTQTIASWLIDHAAPANPEPDEVPTQDTLVTCFLPFAANTSSLEDNARLSWAVEILQRMYFDAHRDVGPTKTFVKAVEAGIAARARHVRDAKVRGGVKGEEDEMYKQQMLESSWRMRVLIEAVEGGGVRRAMEGVKEVVAVDRKDPGVRAKMLEDLEMEWEALG